MPTGYTSEILNGKITEFPQFAKLCMRAFGATVHMRDESLNMEYTPRIPSDYYRESIDRSKEKLNKALNLSDEEIIEQRKERLLKEKDGNAKHIEEMKSNKILLDSFLEKALAYEQPSPEHDRIKMFMIEQLTETIKHDCPTSYYDERALTINKDIEDIDVKSIREEMIADANKDILYYEEEHKKEVERCEGSNKWVVDFLESLKK